MNTLKQGGLGKAIVLTVTLFVSSRSVWAEPLGRQSDSESRLDRITDTADRNNFAQSAKARGFAVNPKNMVTVLTSGRTQNMSPVAASSVLQNARSTFQTLQVYENRNPEQDLDLLVPERDRAKLERIYYGIVDPVYKTVRFEEDIWDEATKKFKPTEMVASQLKSSRKIGFFYSLAGDDTLFELGSGHFESAKTHLSGYSEAQGFLYAPGYPTGRIPLKIDRRTLTFGRLVFQRDPNFLFADEMEKMGLRSEAVDLQHYGKTERGVAVITLEDQAAMQGVDSNSRPMIYNFKFYKAGTNPKDGDYFIVASPTDAIDYFQYPPRLFRADFKKGSLIEYQLEKNEDPHSWSTLFFKISGLGTGGPGENIPWMGVGESINAFLGFFPGDYGKVSISALVRTGQPSREEDVWAKIHHLEPLKGEERWMVSVLAQSYLKGTGVFPPDLMSPYYFRLLALREMGLPDLNGVQVGMPALVRVNAKEEEGAGSAEISMRGRGLGACLQTLSALPTKRILQWGE